MGGLCFPCIYSQWQILRNSWGNNNVFSHWHISVKWWKYCPIAHLVSCLLPWWKKKSLFISMLRALNQDLGAFLCLERFHLRFCFKVISDLLCFPDGSDGKEFACSAGDPDSVPGSGRSPGEGNNNPLQYSCLQNSMDRGAWWATVPGVTKSQTQLSD